MQRAILAAAMLMLASWPVSVEHIARVVDGDTVVTASGVRVRLMHFDAPELRGECPRGRHGTEATAMLQQLAPRG